MRSGFSGSSCRTAPNSSAASWGWSVGEGGLGLGQQVGRGHRAACEFEDLFDEALDLAFGQGALEQVGDLALPEGGDGRDGLHGQAEPGQLLDEGAVLVDVDLDELDAAAGGAGHAFQDGGELFARAAPGGPEIDQDGDVARGFDDFADETGLVGVDDHAFGGGGSRTG